MLGNYILQILNNSHILPLLPQTCSKIYPEVVIMNDVSYHIYLNHGMHIEDGKIMEQAYIYLQGHRKDRKCKAWKIRYEILTLPEKAAKLLLISGQTRPVLQAEMGKEKRFPAPRSHFYEVMLFVLSPDFSVLKQMIHNCFRSDRPQNRL